MSKEYTETLNQTKVIPRPIILITPGVVTHSIVTPKSMTLASDGVQEASDFTLAGNLWSIPATLETVEFYIGEFKVSYTLPPSASAASSSASAASSSASAKESLDG